MKILYIHQYFSTRAGSAGTRSYEFGSRLVADGHEVTVVCGESYVTQVSDAGRRGRPVDVEGITVHQVRASSSNRDGFVKRLAGFLKFAAIASAKAMRLEYDVILCSSTPLSAGLPGILAKRLRGKRFVFEVRDLWPELPQAMGIIRNPALLWLLGAFETACYRAADACIGLSPGIVEGIRAKKRGGAVVEIPNGCDLDLFRPSEEKGLSLRGLSIDDFVAVFCGAHGLANGLDAVLDAAAELKRRGRSDIRLLFVGDGSQKPRLMQRAIDEALDNCVFLDPVPKTEMARILSRSGAGLMILADVPAFQYGTSPNKFFDYIASGLPVLCNYPGWLEGLIAEYDCGLSTPPGDAAAFADALVELADDPPRTRDRGRNSRRLAVERFDRADLYQRLAALLAEVARDRTAQA